MQDGCNKGIYEDIERSFSSKMNGLWHYQGRLGVESVCSALPPGTCWLKVPWPTAGFLSVAASDYHFTTISICAVQLWAWLAMVHSS